MRDKAATSGHRYARWCAAGAAGLASLALLGTGLAGTAQAAYPGQDGKIAFVRNGNIYTIEPGGTDLARLTSGGHHAGPRWGPMGRRIAYLYRGNLWVMHANGSHKTQITSAAPGYTDARPSWSPNGRYLAFVKTRQHHLYGYLTRYDTVTHRFVTFSVPYHSEQPTRRQIRVRALPDPIAWAWAYSGSPSSPGTPGSFILFEGAGGTPFCHSHYYCLDAIGRPNQDMYKNAFPSAEDQTAMPVRLTDPDFFPITPLFAYDVLMTQENCVHGNCTHSGIDLGTTVPPIMPGAYQAVYSPMGRQIAYVFNVNGEPEIFIGNNDVKPDGHLLTAGSQPDWQPLPAG